MGLRSVYSYLVLLLYTRIILVRVIASGVHGPEVICQSRLRLLTGGGLGIVSNVLTSAVGRHP